jgi:hypothetical protein
MKDKIYSNAKKSEFFRLWLRIFWGMKPCSLVDRYISEERIASISLQPLAHAGSSLADFSTLKMEAIRSSETSVHTRSIRRHIPEDGILQTNISVSLNCADLYFLKTVGKK